MLRQILRQRQIRKRQATCSQIAALLRRTPFLVGKIERPLALAHQRIQVARHTQKMHAPITPLGQNRQAFLQPGEGTLVVTDVGRHVDAQAVSANALSRWQGLFEQALHLVDTGTVVTGQRQIAQSQQLHPGPLFDGRAGQIRGHLFNQRGRLLPRLGDIDSLDLGNARLQVRPRRSGRYEQERNQCQAAHDPIRCGQS